MMTTRLPEPSFPAVNLMADRERIRNAGRPPVRTRFWILLAGSVAILIVVMGMQLVPTLLVQR